MRLDGRARGIAAGSTGRTRRIRRGARCRGAGAEWWRVAAMVIGVWGMVLAEGAGVGPTPVAGNPASPAQEHRVGGVRAHPLPGLPEGARPLELVAMPGRGEVKPFLIGKTEVTQAQYSMVMFTNPSFFQAGHDHPVERVGWDDARAFCERLNRMLPQDLKGRWRFRLPTDAEWSLAVGLPEETGATPRARDRGIQDHFPWGERWPPPRGVGNYFRPEPMGVEVAAETRPVGSYPPNPYGLHDLGGNVWEWCEDLYDGPGSSPVLRGASWVNDSREVLLSSRRVAPGRHYVSNAVGFRVAVEILDGTAALGVGTDPVVPQRPGRDLPPAEPAGRAGAVAGHEAPSDPSQLPRRPHLVLLGAGADGAGADGAGREQLRFARLEALADFVYGRFPTGPHRLTVEAVASDPAEVTGVERVRLRVEGDGWPDPGLGPIELELRHPPGGLSKWTWIECGGVGKDAREPAGWRRVRVRFPEQGDGTGRLAGGEVAGWGTIARDAWLMSRVLDYVVGLPGVDAGRLVVAGEGYGGKVALWTAANDERVAGVLAIASGLGGACPFRLWTEAEFGEGIESITRRWPDWFHPQLRLFAGRETRLPVDAHDLLASVAPRACLLVTAMNSRVESPWAVEQAWRAASAVPVDDKAGRWAPGLDVLPGAGDFDDGDLRRWGHWLRERLDVEAGESSPAPDAVPVRITGPVFPTYERWLAAGGRPLDPGSLRPRFALDPLRTQEGERIGSVRDWQDRRPSLQRRVRTVIGTPGDEMEEWAGPAMVGAAGIERGPVPEWLHDEVLTIRPGLTGRVLYRAQIVGTERRLPALIWLHPWSVPGGYAAVQPRAEQPWLAITRSGSVVLTFDQIGCGERVEEAFDFYDRHPSWSLWGRMLADTEAAVTALAAHPHVDPEQIFLLGAGMGGALALHAAALDGRVAAVVSVGGFMPWELDTVGLGLGGLRRWAHTPPLLPRLGLFEGNESQVPYDFEDLLALIAPRPCLVVAPARDSRSDPDAVRLAVEAARPVYALLGNPAGLVLQVTDDYNHFTPDNLWCFCGDAAQSIGSDP